MEHLFIDTSFLVAISNEKDKYHEVALSKFSDIENNEHINLTISDYVIDEFINITIKLYGIQKAISWGRILYNQKLANIIYCTEKIISQAWTILQKEQGERKPMNMTDCVVYVCSSMLKCDGILTFDNRLKNYRIIKEQ